MLRTNLWNDSVSRVVLDHRSREAHLQLERLERLLVHVPQWRLPGSDGFFVLFQRRHLWRRAAREPDDGAAERSAAFAHADNY
jgi:hypothetical protein